MLIKTKLRREKKKRGEDIHARGGEGKRKKERKGRWCFLHKGKRRRGGGGGERGASVKK